MIIRSIVLFSFFMKNTHSFTFQVSHEKYAKNIPCLIILTMQFVQICAFMKICSNQCYYLPSFPIKCWLVGCLNHIINFVVECSLVCVIMIIPDSQSLEASEPQNNSSLSDIKIYFFSFKQEYFF